MKTIILILLTSSIFAQSPLPYFPADSLANEHSPPNRTKDDIRIFTITEHLKIFGKSDYEVEIYFTDRFAVKSEILNSWGGNSKFKNCSNTWFLGRSKYSGAYLLFAINFGEYEVLFFENQQLKAIYKINRSDGVGSSESFEIIDGTPVAQTSKM